MISRVTVAYLSAVNAGSFGLFWYDKQQALKKGWRVPEKTLQLTALAGGWIGGMCAMKAFKHKTVKQPFRNIYFTCVAANVGMGAVLLRRGNFQKLSSMFGKQHRNKRRLYH